MTLTRYDDGSFTVAVIDWQNHQAVFAMTHDEAVQVLEYLVEHIGVQPSTFFEDYEDEWV